DTNGQKTENSRNIVFFAGGNIKVNHNVIFQRPQTSASKTGACVGYKHCSDVTPSTFEVSHNTMWNCYDAAIQSYTYGGRFHHNLILNSTRAFRIWTSGGYTDLSDYIIEKNTFYETQVLDYRPSTIIEGGGNYGGMIYRNNISVFSGPYTGDSGGMHNFDPYGPNFYYTANLSSSKLSLSNNCYYNPTGPVSISYYMANDTTARSLGDIYTFSAWQGLGFDSGSAVINPQFSSYYLPAASQCQNAGMYAP
ncbi:MAG TPA: hypothetical protein PLP17_03510, partial [Oligoflexia bacterium]|nr:hypothetical protein [Oligoflexia bacterium]